MASIEVHLAVGGVGDKSDTFVVFYVNGTPVGRTETIRRVPNPAFVKSFKVDAPHAGEVIKVEVYHEDEPKSKKLTDQQLLGQAEVQVTSVVENMRQITSLVTSGGQARGLFKKESPPLNVYLQAEYINPNSNVITMQWSATGLPNLDLFSKSDPVLYLARMVQDGSYLPVFRTEVINGNLNPVWETRSISLQRLANGDLDRPLLAQVFDMDNNEKQRKLMGQVQTTARALLSLPTLYLLSSFNEPAGSLRPLRMEMQENPPFAGFAPGACEISALQGVAAAAAPPAAAVAPPAATPPLNDKLSQGYDFATPLPPPPANVPVATVVPEVAPMAIPLTEKQINAAPAPVAAPVNWLVKVNTQDGGVDTTVVFVNSTPHPVDVSWVDYEGGESFYSRIEPRRRYEQSTFSLHVWKLSFPDGTPLAYFMVPQSNSIVDIQGVNQLSISANMNPKPAGSEPPSVPTVLVFRNLTQGPLSIRWIEGEGSEEEFTVLHPGQSYRQDTYSNHVWKAAFAGRNDPLCFVTAQPQPQQIDIHGYNQVNIIPLA
ncbi:unnamed protein product [Aphanomyces euteiches]|uniref:C2 domain-containing protein n=1 Tax=Aphanomyces euteiches TaxID=100861 RepID=A0A6G0W5A1_9STRA|nr:hypothetical protein Ae201684_018651 [Aphanomyces euteiches]KAH9094572.1 hypothetical protein LEN26_018245 [Aphanomyces euteiches]KAH9109210.1 hypothetical protein AeMF1_015700 [Aphanomyces euteiches]KAH9156350.1 hypothetical protein AeRB84_001743 [Aphanomyces euteiches]KAH9193139.1 hypothetical protein AeNC1_004895 [Aphanomyces euteiches]